MRESEKDVPIGYYVDTHDWPIERNENSPSPEELEEAFNETEKYFEVAMESLARITKARIEERSTRRKSE